jgi:hypothetical protein
MTRNRSYSIEQLPSDARTWVQDLRDADAAFPTIDPLRMDEEDLTVLADYLETDDGSLDDAALAFSRDAANSVRGLASR